MIDIVDKFNMVDMGGIDIVESQGVAVEGIFSRLLTAIQNCRYQILYNWKFAKIEIAPSYVELVFDGTRIYINEAVSVTEDDVVRVYSLEPEPIAPVIEPLTVSENGEYEAPSGVDGYSPVTVNVSGTTYYESTSDPASSYGSVNDLWVKYTHIGNYLHSLGNNVVYFDTGISENDVYGAEFSFIPIASAENWQIFFSGSNDGFTFGQSGTDVSGAFLRIRGGEKFNSSRILSTGSVNRLSIKDGSIMVNGDELSTYVSSQSLGTDGRNVCLLSAPNTRRKCNVGVMELKLYSTNNNLIFHGVADEQNGQPCIYDRISQNYILSQGSGTLEIVKQDFNIFEKLYKKASSGWTDWFLTQ